MTSIDKIAKALGASRVVRIKGSYYGPLGWLNLLHQVETIRETQASDAKGTRQDSSEASSDIDPLPH